MIKFFHKIEHGALQMKRQVLCDLFKFTPKTLYNWRHEERPAIELIEKYFSEEDIQEFLKTKRISKLQNIERYIKHEKKLMEQIKEIIYSLNSKGKDGLYLIEFIEMVKEDYYTKKEEFIHYINEHPDLGPVGSPYEEDFSFILEHEESKDGYPTGKLLLTPMDIEDYIQSNVFHLKGINKVYTVTTSARSIYNIQKSILELYDNDVLYLLLENITELKKEAKNSINKIMI